MRSTGIKHVSLPGRSRREIARERSSESAVANSNWNLAVVFVHFKRQKHVVFCVVE